MRLQGEVALVTGSTHGIGREIAITFAREGASVVVTGRDRRAGEEVSKQIAALGREHVFVEADLRDPDVGSVLTAEAVRTVGPPTILVNNAGSSDLVRDGTDRCVTELDDDGWARILDVNLTGPMRVTRATLRLMLSLGHGAVLNISSRAARVGVPGIDGYTAVKGAIEALTRSLAVEYAEYGIRCNCIQVSFVQVLDERKGRPSLDADKDERYKRLLLTRGGRPSDIAAAATFLVSRDAEFITGTVIPVDGGAAAVSGMPWVSPQPVLAGRPQAQEANWSPGA